MAKTVKASKRQPTKLRKSITPGTVVIQLAGRYRGKRCIVLKQLESGLLLTTGPYKINGVPLRRVNQKYVIATSTSVPVNGVDVSKIDDAFFARQKGEKEATGTVTSAARKTAQAAVDKALTANISKVEMLESYLKAKFTLKNSDKPHAMNF